jgi:hypothetical protein
MVSVAIAGGLAINLLLLPLLLKVGERVDPGDHQFPPSPTYPPGVENEG